MLEPTSPVNVVRGSVKVAAVARCWTWSNPLGVWWAEVACSCAWACPYMRSATCCSAHTTWVPLRRPRAWWKRRRGGVALRVCGATPSQALRVCAAVPSQALMPWQAVVAAGLSWIQFGPAGRGDNYVHCYTSYFPGRWWCRPFWVSRQI
jgi:hypothetical protein